MSQYGIIYRMEFINVEGFTIRVNISPTDILVDDPDDVVIIPLTGSGTPVVVSSTNNDQDKFQAIRSKSAKIQFVSTSDVDSSTFSQGGDDLWVCDIILQDTPEYIFRGFLIMADNQQPFQPDPQYVTLTATDHLAALKEAALVTLTGENPQGKIRVADLITYCLRKTGLSLQLYVVNNLRAGGGQFTDLAFFSNPGNYITTSAPVPFFYPGQEFTVAGTATHDGTYHVDYVVQSIVSEVHCIETITAPSESATTTFTDTISASHWYDIIKLDAKTFEKEIGVSEDMYTVLEKILGEDCFLTQYKGNWWIFRVDEMEDNPVYVAHFDEDGVYVSTAAGTQYDKSIGATEDHKFANADTLLRFIRPHGFIKETFNFQTPLEVPCNVDFVRGDLNTTISQYEKRYDIECWTLLAGFPGGYISVDGTTAYIQRNFNVNDVEIERFVVLTPRTTNESGSSQPTYIQSEEIPIEITDKFSASCDFRLTSFSVGIANAWLFRVILAGDDGSYWVLGRPSDFAGSDDTPTWYDTAGWTLFTAFGRTAVNFETEDWVTITWDAPPIPVTGKIYFWLQQINQNSASYDNQNVQYANLTFDYIPNIDGSYRLYSGQYNQIDRTQTGYLANRDKEVYISDSPKPILKGGLFATVNSVDILIPNWFAAAPFGNSYPPSTDWLHPYGYIQAYSVWNQFKGYNTDLPTVRGIGINIFQGSVLGLTDDWPDLIHRFTLTDVNEQTISRYFLLISLEQDWRTCIWTATVVEVYNTVILKSYSDPLTFKLIAE